MSPTINDLLRISAERDALRAERDALAARVEAVRELERHEHHVTPKGDWMEADAVLDALAGEGER